MGRTKAILVSPSLEKDLKLHETTTKKAMAIFLPRGKLIRHIEAGDSVSSISLC
jgi:hypothetical protein